MNVVMKITLSKQDFIDKANVAGFIRFLADVMAGQIEVKHSYVDRFSMQIPGHFSVQINRLREHWTKSRFSRITQQNDTKDE